MAADYVKLAENGVTAEHLANIFLKDYAELKGRELIFPINPFQMLTDMGVTFVLRPFKKYEGIYIPAAGAEDFPIVGINLNRPIARQRFTAAHELCHHLKDADNGYICSFNSRSEIERYAEDFAAELLMPSSISRKKIEEYAVEDYVDYDAVLKIADYFGVSFSSCLYRIAWRFHNIKGDTSPKVLDSKIRKYKPLIKRREQGMYDTILYEQLFNAIGSNFRIEPTKFACQKFKMEYIFYDSRLEGVDISQEMAADIVMDLRLNKQESEYCREENRNIIEVAGLTLAYDYAFDNAEKEINIYETKRLNEKLFSTAAYPEYGGRYRESNTLVLGAKFETIDFQHIPVEMFYLDKEIKSLMDSYDRITISEYIERVVQFHHRLTVIHAFRDGNGRTSRAFANMMLMKRHISPVFFKNKEKEEYKEALAFADSTGCFDPLYERFFKSILSSYATLTDFRM